MDAGIIVAIVVVVVLVAALLLLLPRLRRKQAERRLETERGERAELHRETAEDRRARADLAEREAEHARAEAKLHEARADLHERGMADDELREGDSGDRDIVHERERSGAAYEGDPAYGRKRATRDEGDGSDALERDAEGRPLRR
jgi:hypothetical protein